GLRFDESPVPGRHFGARTLQPASLPEPCIASVALPPLVRSTRLRRAHRASKMREDGKGDAPHCGRPWPRAAAEQGGMGDSACERRLGKAVQEDGMALGWVE
ncbi:hypothetical protein EJB05_05186, partial [Eragrostis curvula]